jgi:dipeptidase
VENKRRNSTPKTPKDLEERGRHSTAQNQAEDARARNTRPWRNQEQYRPSFKKQKKKKNLPALAGVVV